FREDLYYRLNTFTIQLPALRERMEDLPLLVDHFVSCFSRELGQPIAGVSAECMQLLNNYTWPGNIRELQSAIKYAIVRCTTNVLTPDCLPAFVGPQPKAPTVPAAPQQAANASGAAAGNVSVSPEQLGTVRAFVQQLLKSGKDELHDVVHSEVDRVLFAEVLRHCQGHQSQAAELLGISRTTFRTRLQSLGLSVGKMLQQRTANDESVV
ncbi:MAG: sigma-54-dependent Fis family transcriptional regulator, partial [Planctomycetaceae bacterium]|nr:sigma-54-dependent Fis family transcriptional regulator [Planctomycetaceae bacterium]